MFSFFLNHIISGSDSEYNVEDKNINDNGMREADNVISGGQ